MSRKATESFICELPLRTTPALERKLDARLRGACDIYNACLREAKKRLRLLDQSKAYRRELAAAGGRKHTASLTALKHEMGYGEYELEKFVRDVRNRAFTDRVDAHVAQKLADRAFQMVDRFRAGEIGEPQARPYDEFDSVEGKANSGLRWDGEALVWTVGFGKSQALRVGAVVDKDDPVVRHGLESRVKFVRLVRRQIRGRKRYYAQLVCHGQPLAKTEPGAGVVGVDVGPAAIAVAGDDRSFLATLADGLSYDARALRRLRRKLERQRRANNPGNYRTDGTEDPKAEGWTESRAMRRTQAAIDEILRRKAATQRTLHGALTNRIVALGTDIRMERLNYNSFRGWWPGSVVLRAPGTFVYLLRRKAEGAGGRVVEFPCRNKLSQTCPCGAVRPKDLREREHRCPECGTVQQRDLMSAWLARFVDARSLELVAEGLADAYAGDEEHLSAAWDEATAQPHHLSAFGSRAIGSPAARATEVR